MAEMRLSSAGTSASQIVGMDRCSYCRPRPLTCWDRSGGMESVAPGLEQGPGFRFFSKII